jgi:predicted urease superfamily metal-dependent hydrolase
MTGLARVAAALVAVAAVAGGIAWHDHDVSNEQKQAIQTYCGEMGIDIGWVYGHVVSPQDFVQLVGTAPSHASDLFQADIQDQVAEFGVAVQYDNNAEFNQQVTYLEQMCRSYGAPVKVIKAP